MRKFFIVLAVLVTLALTATATYIFFLMNAPVAVKSEVTIEVGEGESARSVATKLEEAGIVRNARVLSFIAAAQNMDTSFRHGPHKFYGTYTPETVLRELVTPPRPVTRVTIPEGLTYKEIGRVLEEASIVTAKDYEKAVCDADFLVAAQVPKESNCAEGVLFPDTYDFSPNMEADEVVRLQLDEFKRVMAKLLDSGTPPEHNAVLKLRKAEDKDESNERFGRTFVHDTVTLASIIEKETSIGGERKLVASVFHNRLNKDMLLQADPTAIYGAEVAGQDIDRSKVARYVRQPSPYNTYTSEGLPPGPICNPGRAAIEAALFPGESDFLYFVADGNGGHTFSKSLSEHNRAVRALRRRK